VLDAPKIKELELLERGFPQPPLPPPGVLPAGGGEWPVSPYLGFTGLVNLAARSYRFSFDEALRSGIENCYAMTNDLAIEQALNARKLQTAQLDWVIEPQVVSDPKQVEAATKLTKVMAATPMLQSFFCCLLDGAWYGRQAVKTINKWEFVQGEKLHVTRAFAPINGDKLVFRYGGEIGQLVYGGFQGTTEYTDRGPCHFFTPKERETVTLYQHEIVDASYWKPEMAGALEGIGIRGRCYWYWWLKSNLLAQMMDYSQRFCSGIWEAYYDLSNPQGLAMVQQTIAGYSAGNALIWPRNWEGRTPYGMNVKEVGTANPQFLLSLIQGYCDYYIRLYILGQSTRTESTSVGGDMAQFLAESLANLVRYDSGQLEASINRDFLAMHARYNCPGVPVPKFRFKLPKGNAELMVKTTEAIAGLGGAVDLNQLYEPAGLSAPAAGSAQSTKLQPMTPNLAGQQPVGVPVAEPGAVEPDGDQGVDQRAVPSSGAASSPQSSGGPTVQGNLLSI
jgi:hypothetical protein